MGIDTFQLLENFDIGFRKTNGKTQKQIDKILTEMKSSDYNI